MICVIRNMIENQETKSAPKIGPFFWINDRLEADMIDFRDGRKQADKLDNPCSHEQLYDQNHRSGDYIDFPRGRVVWDTTREIGIIYIDPCIKERAGEIARNFSLTKYAVEEDDHYHCRNCVDKDLFDTDTIFSLKSSILMKSFEACKSRA